MLLEQVLEMAVEAEIEGRELYKMASEKTSDEKAKKVFKMLADEEQSHIDNLVEMAKDYKAGKELAMPDLPAPASFEDAESPIFTREFKEKVSDFDMSALSIGMKLELESERFYKESAEEATEQPVKELFRHLAEWEHGHYEFLRNQVSFFESYYKLKNSLFRF
jgi:rubrerythrin